MPVLPACWAAASSSTPTPSGVGVLRVVQAVDRDLAGCRLREAGHHPQRGGTAGSVGTEGDRVSRPGRHEKEMSSTTVVRSYRFTRWCTVIMAPRCGSHRVERIAGRRYGAAPRRWSVAGAPIVDLRRMTAWTPRPSLEPMREWLTTAWERCPGTRERLLVLRGGRHTTAFAETMARRHDDASVWVPIGVVAALGAAALWWRRARVAVSLAGLAVVATTRDPRGGIRRIVHAGRPPARPCARRGGADRRDHLRSRVGRRKTTTTGSV